MQKFTNLEFLLTYLCNNQIILIIDKQTLKYDKLFPK